jgi:transcriptional regulator with XRE-family HTH domain
VSVDAKSLDKPKGRASSVSQFLSELRRKNDWTLAEMSKLTGVSISSLSKIENGQSQPAYSVLTRLASGLGVDFSELVGGEAPKQRCTGAARTISRAGEGKKLSNDMGLYELLSTELASKLLQPMVPYAPTILSTGDSVYFDAGQPHSFYKVGTCPGRILSVCSADSVPRFTDNLIEK